MVATIRLYQRFVSPLLLPACRYVPSCSQYAAEAVEFHGPAKGTLLAMRRLLRCHPLARGGFDPVPQARGTLCVHHRDTEFTKAHRDFCSLG